MIDLPTKAEVYCSDGAAGCFTNVIFNPITHQMTRLVVQSERHPFHEVLVPVDQVEEIIPNLIRLKCTRNDLSIMEPFEFEEYIRTEMPDYLSWPYVLPMGLYLEEVVMPDGRGALGFTIQMPTEDHYLLTREELEDRLAVMVGGRAAEQVVCGSISTCASDDIQRASALAHRMVM